MPVQDEARRSLLDMARRKLPSLPAEKNRIDDTNDQLYYRAGVDLRQRTVPDYADSRTVRTTPTAGAKSPGMPATVARVLMKRELKEVLQHRRGRLEECEIEANQRQYLVNRMQFGAELPQSRRVSDNAPNVVKCGLSSELVRGARVTLPELPRKSSKSSVSVQTLASPPSTLRFSTRHKELPVDPSLRTYQKALEQIQQDTKKVLMRNVGTQTEKFDVEQSRRHRQKHEERYGGFRFSDNGDEERGARKRRLREEIAKRRHQLALLGTVHRRPISSDYSSHVPHYGSLPRVDFFTRNTTAIHPPSLSDNCRFASLPRDIDQSAENGPRPFQPTLTEQYGISTGKIPFSVGHSSSYLDSLESYYPLDVSTGLSANMIRSTPSHDTGLLSHYAQYLNNQFRMQSTSNYRPPVIDDYGDSVATDYGGPTNASSYGTSIMGGGYVPPTMIRNYDMPAIESAYGTPSIGSTHITPGITGNYTVAPPMNTFCPPPPPSSLWAAPPASIWAQPSSKVPGFSSVYSRGETDYGARPPPYSNYGNEVRMASVGSLDTSLYHHFREIPPYSQFPQSSSRYNDNKNNTYLNTFGFCPTTGHLYSSSYPSNFCQMSRSYPYQQYACQQYPRPPGSRRLCAKTGVVHQTKKNEPEKRSKSGRSRHDRHRTRRYDPNIKRILLTKDSRDRSMRSLGMKVIGGKLLPNSDGELVAYVASVYKGTMLESMRQVKEGDRILEWNGVSLTGKTFEEVQRIVSSTNGEFEVVIRSNADPDIDYEMHTSSSVDKGYESSTEIRQQLSGAFHSQNMPPPVPAHQCLDGKASPCFSTNLHEEPSTTIAHRGGGFQNAPIAFGYLRIAATFDTRSSTLLVSILSARELCPRGGDPQGVFPNPFVKIYLLPGRKVQNKRRTRFVSNTVDPDWNQTVAYKDLDWTELVGHYLEFTVWDYDKLSENNFLGQAIISLADPMVLSGRANWFALQSRDQNVVTSGVPLVPMTDAERYYHDPGEYRFCFCL